MRDEILSRELSWKGWSLKDLSAIKDLTPFASRLTDRDPITQRTRLHTITQFADKPSDYKELARLLASERKWMESNNLTTSAVSIQDREGVIPVELTTDIEVIKILQQHTDILNFSAQMKKTAQDNATTPTPPPLPAKTAENTQSKKVAEIRQEFSEKIAALKKEMEENLANLEKTAFPRPVVTWSTPQPSAAPALLPEPTPVLPVNYGFSKELVMRQSSK